MIQVRVRAGGNGERVWNEERENQNEGEREKVIKVNESCKSPPKKGEKRQKVAFLLLEEKTFSF